MISIHCNIGVNEHGLVEALHKLIETYAYLNWPLVITDTWLRNGQPIPADIVHKAIWNYQHSHPHLPCGITIQTSSNPAFDTLMKNLVPTLDRTITGKQTLDPKYTQERFSLAKPNHCLVRTKEGNQARAFAKLRCFDAFFDVRQWKWRYNTVHRNGGGPLD